MSFAKIFQIMENYSIIAIDPGKSGGIATFAKGKIHAVKMPTGVWELKFYLEFQNETHENLIIFIEKVQAFQSDDDDGGKKFGINKMLANYTELLTVIKLIGIPFVEVYPISWQTSLGLRSRKEKMTKTERKNRYKKFAENSFPELSKITLAISDALCLVQFGLNKFSTDVNWIREKVNGEFKF